MSDSSGVAGVILAGGEGSRFVGSQHKLTASIGGQAVLALAVNAAHQALVDGAFDELIVVSGALDGPELSEVLGDNADRVTLVENRRWRGGQSTSLRAAISYAQSVGHEAIVVGLGDQPFVPAAAWGAVASAVGPIVTATFDGKRRPPVKLEASVWDLLPVTGDHGARHLIASRPDLVNEVVCEGNAADIDTQEDLRRWN